jgi:DNA-binding response OmpR family regulator
MHTNGRRVRRTVLVVNDDPTCRAITARTFLDHGVEALIAKDGYQGIGVLSRRSRDIALLVVDTEMPGVHGWEVIRFARMKAPRMRILRLGRPDDLVPAPEYAPFQALPALPKPFTPAALLASVRQQLGLPDRATRRGQGRRRMPEQDR